MAGKQQSNGAGPVPERAREPAARRRQREVIGQELRRLFDDIAAEPVPDDLTALLDELERKEAGQ